MGEKASVGHLRLGLNGQLFEGNCREKIEQGHWRRGGGMITPVLSEENFPKSNKSISGPTYE